MKLPLPLLPVICLPTLLSLAPGAAGAKEKAPILPRTIHDEISLPVFVYDEEHRTGLIPMETGRFGNVPYQNWGRAVLSSPALRPGPRIFEQLSVYALLDMALVDFQCPDGFVGNPFAVKLRHPDLFRTEEVRWVAGRSGISSVALVARTSPVPVAVEPALTCGDLPCLREDEYEVRFEFYATDPFQGDKLALAVPAAHYLETLGRTVLVKARPEIPPIPGVEPESVVRSFPLTQDHFDGALLRWGPTPPMPGDTAIHMGTTAPTERLMLHVTLDGYSTDTIRLEPSPGCRHEVRLMGEAINSGPLPSSFQTLDSCPNLNLGTIGENFRVYRYGERPDPLPDLAGQLALERENWESVTFPGHYPEPFTSIGFAQRLTLVEGNPGEVGTVGFLQTKELLPPLSEGVHRLRFHLEWTPLSEPSQIHPEVRFRVFQANNERSASTVLTRTDLNDAPPLTDDVYWYSDGVEPWRVAVDLLSFAENMEGGVSVTGIEVLEP